MLKNKNILVGVSGSIAIYKSLELIRLYIKAGANVKVIMSDAAKKFVTTLTFETISQAKILDDTNECWDKDSNYNHIAIGKWADVFVIAPISANTINKLKNGIADNILSQSVLAYTGVKIIAPAANTNMLFNPITQKSLKELKELNYTIVEPVSKELACRDIGSGAMSDIEDIYYETIRELNKDSYWLNRNVVLSGGGTIEKIDDIRYISNFSSGKMASSLALASYLKGANVTLVSTRGHENLPKNIKIIEVTSSNEMLNKLENSIEIAKESSKKAYLFKVAAVSDYIPIEKEGKLKKEDLGQIWNLKLNQNIDILKTLKKEDIYSIAFKAETDKSNALINAKKMLKNKNLDGVCLNIISEENNFGSNENEIELIINNNSHTYKGDKLDISLELLNTLREEHEESY